MVTQKFIEKVENLNNAVDTFWSKFKENEIPESGSVEDKEFDKLMNHIDSFVGKVLNKQDTECLEYLLNNLYCYESWCFNIVTCAAEGKCQSLQTLVDFGVNPHIDNDYALKLAKENKQEEAIKILTKKQKTKQYPVTLKVDTKICKALEEKFSKGGN